MFRLMASRFLLTVTLSVVLSALHEAKAGDPDILSDFIIPPGVNTIDGNFFTYTGMRAIVSNPPPTVFKIHKASMAEFPALNGQSISYAILQYGADSVNPPNTHPRASELLFLMDETLEVGFVDMTNKLFTQTLQSGDIFVFPKGLVHFQYNTDAKNTAMAISGFGSASAGLVSVPNTIFNTTIDDGILAKRSRLTLPPFRSSRLALHPTTDMQTHLLMIYDVLKIINNTPNNV